MLSKTTTLDQYEIPGEPRSVVVHHYSLGALAELEADFRATIPSSPPCAVGVSIELAPVGPRIQTIALATRDKVFCLSLRQSPSPAQCKTLRGLFSNIPYLAGFEFPHTIVLLAHTLDSKVTGYDLSTLAFSKHRETTSPGGFLNSKNESASARRINERWDGDILRSGEISSATPQPDYALRAWFTAIAANMALTDLLKGQQLSTEFVDMPMLRSFVDLACRAIRLDFLKPRVYENDFSAIDMDPHGSITVNNARYKTRIRASKQTRLEISLENGDVVDALTTRARGRYSTATAIRPLNLKAGVRTIRVIGREERTNSEQAQYRFLLHSLTATRHPPQFVDTIWFPRNTQGINRDGEIADLSWVQSFQFLRNLNNSQREVLHAMVSTAPQDSLVIAHGPPGTGKTTTIAAAASIWVSYKVPCWIIAQSNVGVKNIAEKFFREKISFKLIVSQEFLFEWHEELYVEIEDMVIRSDELPDTPGDVARMFGDVTVVLCTLSMLSNPKLDDCGLYRVIPVTALVIDEASQIDVFEFMHLFYKFSNVLTKVCFFGDPKQLPPYGAEEAELETIFNVKHLKRNAYFLNVQYRLPVPLGEFISEEVYLGKLRSCHNIVDHSCAAFIDVSKGEETKEGNSYKNMEEVHMVVRIARRYHQRGLDYCIITFYDPQRAAITKALEDAGLPTGCIYNVDSFQGNEADYVILSSVRTQQAGFLNSRPRMNVALTRCRKGMIVVTNKCFLRGAGNSTLLGQLCSTWSQHGDAWIDWKAILNDSAMLPGLPAPPSKPLGRAVPAPAPASVSAFQRLPAPTKISEPSRPVPHITTIRQNPATSFLAPLSPLLVDDSEAFPPLSSATRTGAPETRQLGRPGAWQFSFSQVAAFRVRDTAPHWQPQQRQRQARR